MSFRGLVKLLAVITLTLPVTASTKVASSATPHKRPMVSQYADGGFWRVDHGFKSQLVLTNVLINSPLMVTPVLYMEDGTRYELKPVTLSPS